jgi:hypothetical protein
MRGLQQQDVYEDAPWDLVAVATNPVELAVAQYIQPKISNPVIGDVAAWLQKGETPTEAISPCIEMNQEKYSDSTTNYPWSGGADCIIVVAYHNRRAYVTHATRVSCGNLVSGINNVGPQSKVYLSSQYFRLGAQSASEAGTVQDVISALQKSNFNVVAIYGSGQLAINARTGAVLSQFRKPR